MEKNLPFTDFTAGGKNYMLRLFAGEQFVLPDYQRAMLVKAGLSVPFIDEIEEKIHGSFRGFNKSKDTGTGDRH